MPSGAIVQPQGRRRCRRPLLFVMRFRADNTRRCVEARSGAVRSRERARAGRSSRTRYAATPMVDHQPNLSGVSMGGGERPISLAPPPPAGIPASTSWPPQWAGRANRHPNMGSGRTGPGDDQRPTTGRYDEASRAASLSSGGMITP